MGTRRSSPNSVLLGSNRVGLGSVVISVTRVIHLGHFLALAGLRVARAAAEAGLRGGAHRRAVFWLQERPTVYNI
jgi:hypothetical protein